MKRGLVSEEGQKPNEGPLLRHSTEQAHPAWRRALTANVLLLGVVSFFADVSSEMLYPLMPLFLTTVLGAPASVVGVIEGLAEATASILKTVSGRIADRTGRRVEQMFGGYLLSAVAKPLIALAHVWPLVLVARVLDRTGKGFRTSPRDAVLADSVDQEVRGAAFGWHRAMDTGGAVVGPLLALALLMALGSNLRLIIALSVIPGLMGAFLVLGVSDPRRRRARGGVAAEPVPSSAGTPERLRWAALPGPFKLYLAAWLPFVLVNSSDVFLILRAKQLGFSMTGVVLVYVLYNAVYALWSVPLGRLSDRLGRRQVILAGMVVFAAVYAGFSLANKSWQVIVLFAVYGLYMAATEGVGKAYAVDLVPGHLRATSVGLLGTLTGVAALVASSVGGVLWDAVGPWSPFALGAAGAAVSAVLFGFLPGLRKPRPSTTS
ncbi:MAG: MFS transporter [Thermoleophilia bacterium]|nr:MFS transporter [Thermoleophilia bacterium]